MTPQPHRERVREAICHLIDETRALADTDLADCLLAIVLISVADDAQPEKRHLCRLATFLTRLGKEICGEDAWREAVEEDDEPHLPSDN